MSDTNEPDVLRTLLDRLDPAVLRAWHGRSLLTTGHATAREIDTLCGLAGFFQAADRARVRTPLFPDELGTRSSSISPRVPVPAGRAPRPGWVPIP